MSKPGGSTGHKGRATAYLALVLVQVFFGTMAVGLKLALRDLPALAIAALRVTAGAVALLVVARILTGPLLRSRADLTTFAGLGIFGVFANQVLFIVGLQWTTAVNAILLIATIPAFTYLFSVLRKEHPADWVHMAGIALAFVGVGIVVGAGGFTREELLGDLFVVLNSASYAWYIVVSRGVVARHPPALVVAWAFVAGAVGIVLVASPTLADVAWSDVPSRAWWTVAYIVAFPTVGSYLFNLVALKSLPSRTVGAFVYLQPVVGASLAVVVLGEPFGAGTVVGAAVVLAGIALVLTEGRPARSAASAT